MIRQKAAIVTGATGYVGSNLVYIATNFLGHGTVNPKAHESDD